MILQSLKESLQGTEWEDDLGMTETEAKQFIRLCTYFVFTGLHFIFPDRKDLFYEDICEQVIKMAKEIGGKEVCEYLIKDEKKVKKLICDMTDLLQTDMKFCIEEFKNIENRIPTKV